MGAIPRGQTPRSDAARSSISKDTMQCSSPQAYGSSTSTSTSTNRPGSSFCDQWEDFIVRGDDGELCTIAIIAESLLEMRHCSFEAEGIEQSASTCVVTSQPVSQASFCSQGFYDPVGDVSQAVPVRPLPKSSAKVKSQSLH